ncbi:MAG TPA: tRNA lysidine(34) synthetase TilS, partial [Ktedonobacterales bacterium]|nr:tRNA lysidine(34) synthetase TilS [Ktedonobacterales bacterium]
MTDERTTIETHIRTSIERHLLLPDAGRVVVAVSGGADSLCLLGVLDALCGPGRYWSRVDLLVAHLNHGLRGDIARADAEWVAACAAELGLPCVVGARDVAAQARHSRRGIEDAARRARYAFLRELAHAQGATRICVGHTRDDQAETLILRWLRGSALTGMTGMRPLNGDIARPLLDLRRTQTQRYCALRGWTPRTDASNADRRYRRNRIRHELLPTLERFNPNLVNTLTRNAQLLADDDAYLEELAADAWNQLAHLASSEEVLLDAAQLAGLPLALRRRVLRRAAYLLQGDEPALEARHIALLELLIAAPTPAHAVH